MQHVQDLGATLGVATAALTMAAMLGHQLATSLLPPII